MATEERKISVEELLKGGEIEIKIANEIYKIKTPFTFEFWIWYFDMFYEYGTLGEVLGSNFHKILSKLTGISENDILIKQTTEEYSDALAKIMKQLALESDVSPFFQKAAISAQVKKMLKTAEKETGIGK